MYHPKDKFNTVRRNPCSTNNYIFVIRMNVIKDDLANAQNNLRTLNPRTPQIWALPSNGQHEAVAESASKQNGNDNGCVHCDF